MTITHHLDDATLMSFAAGSLPEALAAVVAAHIALCPKCAGEARRMERIGGSLLETLRPASVPMPPLLDDALSNEARPSAEPRALASILNGDLNRLAWKFLAIGVWRFSVPLSPAARGGLRLLKVAPGQSIPDHGHGGSELTLVLAGSYSDKTGCYRRGDVADLDEEMEHRPLADGETGCICLLASEGLARFRGIVPRLMQPFTRI